MIPSAAAVFPVASHSLKVSLSIYSFTPLLISTLQHLLSSHLPMDPLSMKGGILCSEITKLSERLIVSICRASPKRNSTVHQLAKLPPGKETPE